MGPIKNPGVGDVAEEHCGFPPWQGPNLLTCGQVMYLPSGNLT